MKRRVPDLYYSLTLLTSFAASLFVPLWFRQLTGFYGSHSSGILALIIPGFLCLIAGSTIFGLIADKIKKPFLLYIILTSITLLFVLLQKPLSELFSHFYFRMHSPMPRNFWLSALPFFYFLVPLSFMAGMLPLVVRYCIRNVSNAGHYMSATLFSISTGIILAITMSMVLIPKTGIMPVYYCGTLALLFSLVVAVFHTVKRREKDWRSSVPADLPKTESIRFRKKKIVLETGAKLTRAMLYGSVFQAFSFSSMLIIAIRILIKYNQLNTAHFYSIVLLNTFLGLAIGSLMFNRVASRPANKYLTLASLQITAGIASLLVYALYLIFTPAITEALKNSENFAGFLTHHFVLAALLLFIPSVIHGMSLPLAGRLYPKRIQQIGRTFGQLASLILFSLLTGIILAPMVFIPLIGIGPAYIFLSTLVLLTGIYLIARDSRLIRGFRFAFAFAAILLFVFILIAFRLLNINQRNRAADGSFEGSTTTVNILENEDNTQSVYINGMRYFGTDPESMKQQVLSAAIPLIINDSVRSVYMIGFGTGIPASLLDYYVSEIHITDISPEVIRLSSSAFADENKDILTGGKVAISISDARHYLVNTGKNFDLILSGTEQSLMHKGSYTAEFYRICRDRLTDPGMFCQVIDYNRLGSQAFFILYNTCSGIFEHVSLWYLTSGSFLMTGSKTEHPLDYCRVSGSFAEFNRIFSLEKLGIPSPSFLLAHYILNGDTLISDEKAINTDSRPVLEFQIKKSVVDSAFLPNFQSPADFSIPDSCSADPSGVMSAVRSARIQLQQAFRFSLKNDADFSAWSGLPFRRYP